MQTRYEMQTADRVQSADQVRNKDCRLDTKTENEDCFLAKHVITCDFIIYQVSRNRFSTVVFITKCFRGSSSRLGK